MRYAFTGWHGLAFAAAILVAAVGGIIFWLRRRPDDPEEIERKRRTYLNQIGRIVEGEIVEIADAPAEARAPRRGSVPAENGEDAGRKLLFYTYSISGVTYETAQDVTGMEERACLDRLVAGQSASVKYDPSNPSNSILIADDWSGLH